MTGFADVEMGALLDALPHGVAVRQRNKIVYANAAFAERLGYQRERIIGRQLTELVHPDDRDALSSRLPTGGSIPATTLEVRFQHESGEYVLFEVSPLLVVTFGGASARMLVARDLTDRYTQAALLQAERLASMGMLAAGVAHEINNPLAYVLSNLELSVEMLEQLAQQAPSTASRPTGQDAHASLPAVLEMLQQVLEGVDRVRSVVKDLQTFSRSDEDRQLVLDVHKVLDAALRMTSNEVRHRARVAKSFGQIPPVRANESRLGQVFLNLLVNAAQAIPVGNAANGLIEVRTQHVKPNTVRIEIRDNGAGIDLVLGDRLFGPFATTKENGTGLGLFVCKRIVDGLGGSISAQRSPSGGTIMRVDLPAATKLPAAGVPARRSTRRPPPAPRPGGRVLIIDDERQIGAGLRRALEPECEVALAASGREGLALLEERQDWDLILCDVMMPEMSGIELHTAALQRWPNLASRIVFVTGGAFTAEARDFLSRIPNRRLLKPFDLNQLRALLGSKRKGGGK